MKKHSKFQESKTIKLRNNILYDILSNNNEVTFCLLDIDDFTQFNFLHGFELGNVILKKVEAIIKAVNPEKVFYLGSDEYFIYWQKPFNETKAFLFQLMQVVETELNVTISIGATENTQRHTPEQIIEQLKLNVQIAKAHGKNKIYTQ